MVIPSEMLKVAAVASRDATRYAINSVRCERVGRMIRTVATDGRRLLAAWCRGMEPSEQPSDGRGGESHGEQFAVTLPLDAVHYAVKMVPTRRKAMPVVRAVCVSEPAGLKDGPAGAIKIGGGDIGAGTVRHVKSVDGHYPDVDLVMKRPRGKPAVVYLNPVFLAELLTAMAKTVGADAQRSPAVRISTWSGTHPVFLEMIGPEDDTHAPISAVGILMPIRGDSVTMPDLDPRAWAVQPAGEPAPAQPASELQPADDDPAALDAAADQTPPENADMDGELSAVPS